MAARIISVGVLVWIQANYVPYEPYDEPCFVTSVNITNLGWNVVPLPITDTSLLPTPLIIITHIM